jgi:hypothetical protein
MEFNTAIGQFILAGIGRNIYVNVIGQVLFIIDYNTPKKSAGVFSVITNPEKFFIGHGLNIQIAFKDAKSKYKAIAPGIIFYLEL